MLSENKETGDETYPLIPNNRRFMTIEHKFKYAEPASCDAHYTPYYIDSLDNCMGRVNYYTFELNFTGFSFPGI